MPHQYFILSLLNFSHSVLIYISLITNETEHHRIRLLTAWVSLVILSLFKCIFQAMHLNYFLLCGKWP